MKFRISGIFILAVLALLLPSRMLQAHEYKISGPLTILLHSEPEDNPWAGEAARLYLHFHDEKNEFNVRNCECALTVLSEGRQIARTAPAALDDSMFGSNVLFHDLTFPAVGVYQVRIEGRDRARGLAFDLTYNLRIERDRRSSDGAGMIFPAAGFGILILSLVLFTKFRRK